MIKCPKCGRPMRYVDSTSPDPQLPAKYYVWRCSEHGLYYFSKTTDLRPGLPPDD
jgi:hypothetical protein